MNKNKKTYFSPRFKVIEGAIISSEKASKSVLGDIVIDWEERRIFAIFPYMIHSEGFMYEELGNRIQSGKATLLQLDDEELCCYGKNEDNVTEWHDKVEIYSDEIDEEFKNKKDQ